MEDSELLLVWRNDPAVRRASHDQSEIELHAHQMWLRESLENPNRKIFIAEMGDVPVGTVRSDFQDGTYELSWTVAPEAREQGIGKLMVSMLAAQIEEPIRAEVRIGNVASVRIAEHVGMALERIEDGILYFRRGN
ncbi:MAG TPA: GNAT family N-acetyltransferase [Anaerolineae bacterium]|nr:GNAT family N-acetyltransferase [Anaerolineae bacterium]